MIADSAPPKPACPPRHKAPSGTVDTHIHMLAAPHEFPLWDKRVENPAPGLDMDDFITRYRAQMDILGVTRTVVVHSILFGADNAVTLEAIRRLGPATTRGIALLKDGASEADVARLAEAGVKGIRLNYVHGGVLSWEGAKTLAPILAAHDMHLQMLVNADKHMADLAPQLSQLPVPVVFDHIGWPNVAAGSDEPGFQALCALLAEGSAYVKLSAPYRTSRAPYTDTDPLLKALVAANPQRCLWGSDWPYIMLADAEMPDAGQLLDAFMRAVPSRADQQTILVDTPAHLYGFC